MQRRILRRPAPPSARCLPCPLPTRSPPRRAAAATFVRLLIVCLLLAAYLPVGAADRASASGVDHLVVSEVMTGGVECQRRADRALQPVPGPAAARGTRARVRHRQRRDGEPARGVGPRGAGVPPGAHVLVANELGIFAPIADALYASGMAATGGSVALRIQGATTAIDAVGWGTATSTWLEGAARGRAAGRREASNDSRAGRRARPSTRTTTSPTSRCGPCPIRRTADRHRCRIPTADADADTGHPPTRRRPPPDSDRDALAPPDRDAIGDAERPSPTATPTPVPISIAAARGLADGTMVTVEGDAMTASDFSEGGGYIADATGGVARAAGRGLVCARRAPHRPRRARRSLRAAHDPGDRRCADRDRQRRRPGPGVIATGSVDESVEARLVRIAGHRQRRPDGAQRRPRLRRRRRERCRPRPGRHGDRASTPPPGPMGSASPWSAWSASATRPAPVRPGIAFSRVPRTTSRCCRPPRRRRPPARLPARAHAHAVTVGCQRHPDRRRAGGRQERTGHGARRRHARLGHGRGRLGGHPGCDRSHHPAARRRGRVRLARPACRGRRHAVDQERHGDAAGVGCAARLSAARRSRPREPCAAAMPVRRRRRSW